MLVTRNALLAILVYCTPVAAARVDIGGSQIALPEPPPYTALQNQSSPYYRFSESIQAKVGNRLVAAYLPKADARVADEGGVPSPDGWAIVFMLNTVHGRPVTPTQFARELVPMIEKDFGKTLSNPELRKKTQSSIQSSLTALDKELEIDPRALKVGQVTPLGIYDKTDNYITYGSATRFEVSGATGKVEVPVFMVLCFILVKNRLLAFVVYRNYTSAAEIEPAKQQARRWAAAITNQNR